MSSMSSKETNQLGISGSGKKKKKLILAKSKGQRWGDGTSFSVCTSGECYVPWLKAAPFPIPCQKPVGTATRQALSSNRKSHQQAHQVTFPKLFFFLKRQFSTQNSIVQMVCTYHHEEEVKFTPCVLSLQQLNKRGACGSRRVVLFQVW